VLLTSAIEGGDLGPHVIEVQSELELFTDVDCPAKQGKAGIQCIASRAVSRQKVNIGLRSGMALAI
jgi:hypothetical protein